MYSYNSAATGLAIGWIIGGLVTAIIFGLITKHINESKGYEGGFAWGFWLNIIGIIVVACKPDNRSYSASGLSPYQQSVREQEYQSQASSAVVQQKGSVKSTDSSIELIKQLADLHSMGILTDEEFNAKKTSLLEKVGCNELDILDEITPQEEKYKSNGWIIDDDKEFVRCPQCNKRMCIDFIKARKKCPDCGREY